MLRYESYGFICCCCWSRKVLVVVVLPTLLNARLNADAACTKQSAIKQHRGTFLKTDIIIIKVQRNYLYYFWFLFRNSSWIDNILWNLYLFCIVSFKLLWTMIHPFHPSINGRNILFLQYCMKLIDWTDWFRFIHRYCISISHLYYG